MSTLAESFSTSTVLPRVRVKAQVFKRLDLLNVEEHGVKVSYSHGAFVKTDSIHEIARSQHFSTRHFPRLYHGDLDFNRDYVELSDVKVEGSQGNVQMMLGRLKEADRSVENQHPDLSMSIYFWGLPEKIIGEFSEKFNDVIPGCIYGFSFHGVFNRKFVHGKSVFNEDSVRCQALFKAVESFGGFYIVSQEAFVKFAI